MRLRTILSAGILLLLLAGCIVTSLHPLFTEEDAIFNPKLVGTWLDPAEKNSITWDFQASNDKYYNCVVTEKGKKYHFIAAIGHLGDSPMLDLYIKQDVDTLSDLHLLPAHSFWKISLKNDALTLSALNYEWLAKKSKAGQLDLAHELLDKERIILTADTAALQKFILKHENDKDAFTDPHTWRRQKKDNAAKATP